MIPPLMKKIASFKDENNNIRTKVVVTFMSDLGITKPYDSAYNILKHMRNEKMIERVGIGLHKVL